MSKNKRKEFFSGLLRLVLRLLLIGIIYVAASVLHSPEIQNDDWRVVEEQERVTPLQAGASSDPAVLKELFGAPLPVLKDYPMVGRAENVSHDGQTARKVTLDYNGFTVSAVRPASAAALLLRDELSVSLRTDLILLGDPAVLAAKEDAYCLYFSDQSAAYSVYAPQITEETFLQLLDRLQMLK